MTYKQAYEKAYRIANETGESVLIYKSTLPNGEEPDEGFDTAFTLPVFGIRVGDRVYPGSRKRMNGSTITPVIAILTALTTALVLLAQSGLLHLVIAEFSKLGVR